MSKQKTELKFSSLKTLAVGAIDPANPPKRLKIFNWGNNVSASKGTFKVGDKTLATLSANQKKFAFDTVALDYEHNTFPGSEEYKRTKEPRDVAGNGPLEVIAGDGVYLNVEWTPDGPKKAPNYPDLSPVPATDENGEVIFIHSVALCRQGEVADLHFSSLAVELPFDPDKDGDDDSKTFDLFRRALSKLLGLDANATDEQIEAKISAANLVTLSADIAKLPELVALNAEIANLKSQIAEQKTQVANFQSLETKLTTLSNDWKKQFNAGERETICLLARYDGKDLSHLSADIISGMTPLQLRDVVSKIKSTIPVTRLTPLSVNDPAAKDKAAADAKAAARKEKASELGKQNPGWSWSRCWEEAGK